KRATARRGMKRARPAARKKAARVKPGTGATARRAAVPGKASPKQVRTAPAGASAAGRSGAAQETLIEVGRVMHFFAIPNAAAIEVTGEGLALGDLIRIKGHTTDLRQVVTSMQIEHMVIDRARRGDVIGLQVEARVREQDTVFKVAGLR
ncbi:MAG: hypothetical protein ACE5FC_05975, partial [Myxococcota bacterium]